MIGLERLAKRCPSKLKAWALSKMTEDVLIALREEIRPNIIQLSDHMGDSALFAHGMMVGMTYICDRIAMLENIDGTKPQDRRSLVDDKVIRDAMNKYGYDDDMIEKKLKKGKG